MDMRGRNNVTVTGPAEGPVVQEVSPAVIPGLLAQR